MTYSFVKDNLYLKITPSQKVMVKRREAIFLAEEIYFFLGKSPKKKYSINKISKKIKAKYEVTIKCLQFLKKLNLVKETKGDNKPIPERFFQFLR